MSESDEKARRKRRETVQPLGVPGASGGIVRERRGEIDEDGDALKIQILGEGVEREIMSAEEVKEVSPIR